MAISRTGWWRPVALAALATLGCGPGHDYELAPVRGTVTVDGQPLAGGRVMFAPVAAGDAVTAGKPGFGDIDADGSFVVTTYAKHDGAVVAEHWVTVLSADSDAAKQQLLGASRVTVPQRKTVAAGVENEVPIELTTDVVKRFGEGAD